MMDVDRGASYTGTNARDVSSYRADPHIWNTPRAGQTNPWHPDLNNTMFYLLGVTIFRCTLSFDLSLSMGDSVRV
jgi:hypothetical protein